MSMPLIALVMMAVLVLGYRAYGRFIARSYALDDGAVTPAVRREDGVDYVPTRPFYLLPQHFSAIAAAGPIAGPILACHLFGWLPCLLWIGFGVIFIGAVHDFSSLIGSVRHDARSVAEIIRDHVGKNAWLAMMAFIYLALLYVLVAFTDVTAGTFVGATEELEGIGSFNPGGAVAIASVMYLLLAILMGYIQKKFAPAEWKLAAVFVPAALGLVWFGTKISTILIFPRMSWVVLILLYCAVAALMPLWLLLQPRGFLGGYVLYIALAVGVIGLFFGGFPVAQPAFKGWTAPGATGLLFPFLFVTIACGACSGFHGLVCSGTTSKQIQKEGHTYTIGYGGMILEAFVAVIALATIMKISPDILAGGPIKPGKIYGDGLGDFLAVIIGPDHVLFARTFGAMAFSTFVFDTLDVATRLGRYILQELTGTRGNASAVTATIVTAAIPAVILFSAPPNSYLTFWTLFGASNQLLAALTLMGITVWLAKTGKKTAFTFYPMVFVLVITVWALAIQVKTAFAPGGIVLNGVIGLALLGLAAYLGIQSFLALRENSPTTAKS